MPQIILNTFIKATPQVVFDLARNIDVHKDSTAHTGETAIAGVTSGLINLGESVTWKAKHLGFWFTLTSKITRMENPQMFVDEMESGPFKNFCHEHYFIPENNGTVMKDVFCYESPFGIAGRLADIVFLKNYMEQFLTERNKHIKKIAEL